MKIVIATAVYYPMTNGVAVFSHNLAIGLAKRGHEVLVLCPSQTGKNYSAHEEGVRLRYLKSIDAKIYPDQINPVPAKRKAFGRDLPRLWYSKGIKVSVFPAIEIKRALDDFEPDVVHIQVSDPIGLSVASYARKRGIPIVTTEHNQPEVITEPLKVPNVVKKPVNHLLSSYFRNRHSKSDFVTMPTEQSIRHLLAKKPIDVPIAAVSNGVDLSHFQPGKAKEKIYHKYHIPNNVPIILYVGRLDPEKRVDLVIEAFKRARAEVPTAELVIAGDGVDKARLIKVAKKTGAAKSIHFLGRVLPPDLYEIYKVGSVFATASEIETQGIVLIEAAATGLPLVAVNRGAVSEVCVTNVNGYLCTPGDISELKDALIKILSSKELQQKFSQGSIKIAAEHDFERTLDKFINIYHRVTKDKNMV